MLFAALTFSTCVATNGITADFSLKKFFNCNRVLLLFFLLTFALGTQSLRAENLVFECRYKVSTEDFYYTNLIEIDTFAESAVVDYTTKKLQPMKPDFASVDLKNKSKYVIKVKRQGIPGEDHIIRLPSPEYTFDLKGGYKFHGNCRKKKTQLPNDTNDKNDS